MPVIVKTPACASVVCPPPANATGNWAVSSDAQGLTATFTDANNTLKGFVLLGQAVSDRQRLTALVAPPWQSH